MKISIITVTYNNREGLKRTMVSIANQTCKDFEYIVVDGASNDGSIDIIHQYEDCITHWVSEPDTGIYNAMNKGVKIAKGDYCLFINSGDELYNIKTIEKINACDFDEDYVQGIISRTIKGRDVFINPPKNVTLGFYLYGQNNYHQASLIRRKMLLDNPYDEKLRIASDYKFNIECLVKNECSFKPIDIVIAKYELGGRSVTVGHDEEPHIIYSELFSQRILEDYRQMEFCFKFPVKYILPVLRWIGNMRCFKKRYKQYGEYRLGK